jgi:hypothetical protein
LVKINSNVKGVKKRSAMKGYYIGKLVGVAIKILKISPL